MKNICGIQQIGTGIPNVDKAWEWYRKNFGMDIPVFKESAEAALMTPYTGGKVHARKAVLAINLQGGGGMEIWQYTSRKTQAVAFETQLGDYGIFVGKIKCLDVQKQYDIFKKRGLNLLGPIQKDPSGKAHFFVKDPYDMIFQVIESSNWFTKGKHLTGGVAGSIIGVSNIENSLKVYRDILEYDTIVYDKTGSFDDFASLPGGDIQVRRVLLMRSKKSIGGFSEMLGEGSIELVQALNKKTPARKIFENRYWGDQGFIHLCFDVQGMEELKKECEQKGFPFTVDSANSFDMGEASGHFSYIEDPDGTLIEFVETHKIPIVKKLNWYLDVRKRDPKKPIPKWMLKALAISRVRD